MDILSGSSQVAFSFSSLLAACSLFFLTRNIVIKSDEADASQRRERGRPGIRGDVSEFTGVTIAGHVLHTRHPSSLLLVNHAAASLAFSLCSSSARETRETQTHPQVNLLLFLGADS